MIYDVILVGIFLLLIIINAHRGAAKALAGLVCSMISYLAATALGKIVSTLIYDSIVLLSNPSPTRYRHGSRVS